MTLNAATEAITIAKKLVFLQKAIRSEAKTTASIHNVVANGMTRWVDDKRQSHVAHDHRLHLIQCSERHVIAFLWPLYTSHRIHATHRRIEGVANCALHLPAREREAEWVSKSVTRKARLVTKTALGQLNGRKAFLTLCALAKWVRLFKGCIHDRRSIANVQPRCMAYKQSGNCCCSQISISHCSFSCSKVSVRCASFCAEMEWLCSRDRGVASP